MISEKLYNTVKTLLIGEKDEKQFKKYYQSLDLDYVEKTAFNRVIHLFKSLGIEYAPVKIEVDMLNVAPKPCLLYIRKNDSLYIADVSEGEDLVLRNGSQRISSQDTLPVLNEWEGDCLVLDIPEDLHIPQVSNAVGVSRVSLLVIISSISALILFLLVRQPGTWAMTLINSTGLFVSLLITMQANDIGGWVNEACGLISKRKNCAGLSNSSFARLGHGITWASMGVFYYLVIFCIAVFSVHSKVILQIYFSLNIIAFAFIPYSLYIQGVVAKMWCSLCLVILSCLFISGISSFFLIEGEYFQSPPLEAAFQLFFSLVSSFTLTLLLDRYLAAKKEVRRAESVSHLLLKQGVNLLNNFQPINTEGLKSIQEAPKWVFILSLNCPYCNKRFNEAYTGIRNGIIKDYLFVITHEINETPSTPLLSYYLISQREKDHYLAVLYQWFNSNKGDLIAQEIVGDWKPDHNWIEAYQRERDWVINNGISTYPSVISDGKIIPNGLPLSSFWSGS